jgi:hypothetical protein
MKNTLFSVLRERGPEFTGKVKAANFAANHPHLLASALGAGFAAGLTAKNRGTKEKDGLIRSAYKGALLAGGASLAAATLAKKASAGGDAVAWALKKGKDFATQNKPELIGGLAGAGLAALIGAATGVRPEKGKPSVMEGMGAKMQAKVQAKREELKAQGKKPGFSHKLTDVQAKAFQGLAKAVAEHPGAGALFFGASGASLGSGIGRDVAEHVARWRK